jgi:hypothetical protein
VTCHNADTRTHYALGIVATSHAEALERNGEPVHPRLQGPLQDIDRALVARRHLRRHCTYAGASVAVVTLTLGRNLISDLRAFQPEPLAT